MRVAAGAGPEARALIDDLYATYVERLDDGDIARWPDLFTDDGCYLVVAKENDDRGLPLALMRCESRDMIRDRVRAIIELSMYEPRVLRHVLGALRMRPAATTAGSSGAGTEVEAGAEAGVADRFDVHATYVVFQTLADRETQILSTGRYRDVVVIDGESARFERKVCVYDNPLVVNSLVFPL